MQTTGASDLGVLKQFFGSGEYGAVEFKIPRSNPAVRDRLQVVNAALQRVKIDARCKELIKDLEQVAYKENTQVIDKDRDPKRTHLSDALGYLMWQEFRVGRKVERGGEADLMGFSTLIKSIRSMWRGKRRGGSTAICMRAASNSRRMRRNI